MKFIQLEKDSSAYECGNYNIHNFSWVYDVGGNLIEQNNFRAYYCGNRLDKCHQQWFDTFVEAKQVCERHKRKVIK